MSQFAELSSVRCFHRSCRDPRPVAWATTNTLSRMCAAPMAQLESTPHSASNPIAARSPRTRSIPRSSKAETFSTRTMLGRISRMILAYSRHNPDRSPSIPAPRPATLMSWQGNPAWMQSKKSSFSFPKRNNPVLFPFKNNLDGLGRVCLCFGFWIGFVRGLGFKEKFSFKFCYKWSKFVFPEGNTNLKDLFYANVWLEMVL